MQTPFFPAFRLRLAALGRRVQLLRQQSLCHLELLLHPFLPPGLLSQADEGANSRERVFSVRRTFYGFLSQVLKPDTACREIVRQIQALFVLQDHGAVDEGTAPTAKLASACPWTGSAACEWRSPPQARKRPNSGMACDPSSSMAPPSARPTPPKISGPTPSPAARNPDAVSR